MRFQASLAASVLAIFTCAHGAAELPGDLRALVPRAAPASNACALAASASASYLKASPSATAIAIPANLANDCLQTIPNKPGPAIDLLNALESWIEFQSDKTTYLLNPPAGYLFPPVDIDNYMGIIRQNVQDGNYQSEYDFQVDIQTMMIGAKDGHFIWNGDATGLFVYQRSTALAAVSVDGKQHPQIYIIHDLIHPNGDGTKLLPVTAWTPSPVKEINGIDALQFLLSQCLIGLSQDPDSLYNQNFFQLAKVIPGVDEPSNFEFPRFYPGAITNVTFNNGSTAHYPNVALVEVDLTGISNGEDMYTSFCTPKASTSSRKEKRAANEPRQGGNPVQFYPEPVIAHSANAVSGYFLDKAGLEDVAVLAIYTFEPSNPNEDNGGELEFQQVVQKFLAECGKAGKRKLIVDLQGNGGGLIDLGLDTFAQIFPTMKPNVKSNMRGSIGMNLLAQSASLLVTQDLANKSNDADEDNIDMYNVTPFAYQSVMTENATIFPTFNSFYGPVYRDGGHFTNFFQNNYTNAFASDPFGQGIIITGNGNRTGFTQLFRPHDVILLHDGFCASTCTTFSEFMKNYAHVQSIAIGGRPQDGPMQGVGGIKGAQIFQFQQFPSWIELFHSGEDVKLKQATGTVFENFTDLPFQRSNQGNPGGVNGRNSFRFGDTSNTPLQYVYEASDCRLWWTQEMLYDPTFLWNRVAETAFQNRISSTFNSDYCIKDSTGHPTSIGGGWEHGTLGPQTPPDNAKLQTKGWIVDGDTIQQNGPADEHNPVTVSAPDSPTSSSDPGQTTVHKSQAITDACKGYTGDLWLVKMVCGALSY